MPVVIVLQENATSTYGEVGPRSGNLWKSAVFIAAILASGVDELPAREGPEAARVAQVESAHLSLAAAYETQVRELEAVIAEHERMRREGVQEFHVDDRLTPAPALNELDGHYGRVIEDARKLREHLLELAGWHKMRAGELRGP